MTGEVYDSQNEAAADCSRKSCPPHGPHLVEDAGEGSYAARCLKCGLVGPVRQDASEAMLAFDQIP